MTAYLQPGDKIHITVPGDWGSRAVGQKKLEEIVRTYESMGIKVFAATPVIHSEQVAVVCVIREAKAPAPPLMHRKAPWQESPENLRAHWDPPYLTE